MNNLQLPVPLTYVNVPLSNRYLPTEFILFRGMFLGHSNSVGFTVERRNVSQPFSIWDQITLKWVSYIILMHKLTFNLSLFDILEKFQMLGILLV